MHTMKKWISSTMQGIIFTESTEKYPEIYLANMLVGNITGIPYKLIGEYHRLYGCSTKTSLHDNNIKMTIMDNK